MSLRAYRLNTIKVLESTQDSDKLVGPKMLKDLWDRVCAIPSGLFKMEMGRSDYGPFDPCKSTSLGLSKLGFCLFVNDVCWAEPTIGWAIQRVLSNVCKWAVGRFEMSNENGLQSSGLSL